MIGNNGGAISNGGNGAAAASGSNVQRQQIDCYANQIQYGGSAADRLRRQIAWRNDGDGAANQQRRRQRNTAHGAAGGTVPDGRCRTTMPGEC